jgi:hypothetical protein
VVFLLFCLLAGLAGAALLAAGRRADHPGGRARRQRSRVPHQGAAVAGWTDEQLLVQQRFAAAVEAGELEAAETQARRWFALADGTVDQSGGSPPWPQVSEPGRWPFLGLFFLP